MMMETIRPAAAIDAALLDRAVALQSTAEYLACLIDIVIDITRKLQFAAEPVAPALSGCDDWRQIITLLNLADTQVGIVAAFGQDADLYASAQAA